MNLPIVLRKGLARDVPFITSSWLRSFRDAPFVRGVPNNIFYYQHHKVLEHLIPRSIVVVACSEDDPDLIVGWVCAELVDTALVVHYVYVKHDYRRMGVAKALLTFLVDAEKPPAVMYTHKTKAAIAAAPEGWMYNPYLIFRLARDWENA